MGYFDPQSDVVVMGFDPKRLDRRCWGMSTSDSRRQPKSRRGPDFDLESAEIECGNGPVAGVDEAGRGPWAGPVVAAAVILDATRLPPGINDSKALKASARAIVFEAILASARVGIGIADAAHIDRDNIAEATHFAMAQAVANLSASGPAPRLVLVDGNRLPVLPCTARAIVRGDALCLSIAAASIVAKVTRDQMMIELACAYPGYGFEHHKGYGTAAHQAALERLGVSPIHRRSFKPIRLALERET